MAFSTHPNMVHKIVLLDYRYQVIYFFSIFFNAQISSFSDIEISHLADVLLSKIRYLNRAKKLSNVMFRSPFNAQSRIIFFLMCHFFSVFQYISYLVLVRSDFFKI